MRLAHLTINFTMKRQPLHRNLTLQGDYMAIDKDLLDRLLADFKYTNPGDLTRETGLPKQRTQGLLDRR